jgi:hypothetical protein
MQREAYLLLVAPLELPLPTRGGSVLEPPKGSATPILQAVFPSIKSGTLWGPLVGCIPWTTLSRLNREQPIFAM